MKNSDQAKTATTNLQTEISGVKTRAERMGSSLATQYTNVLAELRAEKLAREQAFAARSQSASRDAVGVVPTFIAGQPGKLGDTNGRPSLPRRVVSAASSLAHYDYPMVVAAMPANTNVWKAGTLLRGSQARRFKINGGWGNGKERAVAVDYGLFVKAEADVADNTVQSVTEEVVNRFHNHHGKTFAEGAIDRLSRETEINFLEKVRPYFDKVVTSRGMTNTLSLDNVSYTIL